MITIDDICAECKNYFVTEKVFDTFTIADGVISPFDFVQENEYFRILGSAFNYGVYINTPEGLAELKNETFDGAIWVMAVPKQIISATVAPYSFTASIETAFAHFFKVRSEYLTGSTFA